MKIAIAQINPTVGDIAGNSEKIVSNAKKAKEMGSDLVLFPEMALTGYPPRDLLARDSFVQANVAALAEVAKQIPEIACIVGYVERNPLTEGKPLYDAAAILQDGAIQYIYYKTVVPKYPFFDQQRYFEPAVGISPIKLGDKRIAVTICEDLWTDELWGPRNGTGRDVLQDIAKKKVEVVVNIAASPYFTGFDAKRLESLKKQAVKHKVPIVMCNQVGGNDDLVFDGSSCAISPMGEVIARAKSFDEDLIIVDLVYGAGDIHDEERSEPDVLYHSMVLGIRDYVRKCGFSRVLVGLSGGIDSAVTTCAATEALGKENVVGVSMPSAYSSPASISDAQALASQLGIRLESSPIQSLLDGYRSALNVEKTSRVDQNLQSRIRSNVLMALANKLEAIVLSTGNRSELMTGYCTIYGDLTGGLAPLAEVSKGMVYRIAKEVINKDGPVIPENILTKAPSAELKPGQKDSDDLPEYGVLDQIITAYVDEAKSVDEIAQGGLDRAVVEKVAGLIRKSEFKRRQGPIALRITSDYMRGTNVYPVAQKM